ncbi:ABC transporter permease, partial [Clostridioides difficile]|nr:ABC transporter permease [Clostridioides difficile]MDO0404745.1 ABC transporter permease [Clostridioides difficile]
LKGVGDNSQMIKSLGINIGSIKILGLMISNGLIALSGSLMAQFLGFSDVNMGIGTLVLGIASIIIGITLFKKFTFIKDTTAIIVGSFIYQFTIYFAMSLGMLSTDLKLITA